jgi:orotidine-5'-phosphate decarboxylase
MRKIITLTLVLIASGAAAQGLSTSEKMQLRQACAPEMKRLCPGIKPGGGELKKCLQDNKDQLSPTCAEAIMAIMPAPKK